MKATFCEWSNDVLQVRWADDRVSAYAAIWLFDNHERQRDSGTGQRIASVAGFPAKLEIESVVPSENALTIRWNGLDDTWEFQNQWLLANDPGSGGAKPDRPLWGRDYRPFTSDRVTPEWLDRLVTGGIAMLRGVPCESGQVLTVASQFGIVTETNYGRLFDVQAVAQPENLAYTSLGLGLHTDNPYRDPVPGYQALHMLSAVEGGDSLFADGFAVAERLHETDSRAFETLTQTPVPFGFRSPAAEFRTMRPMIDYRFGEVEAIHFNERAMATLRGPVDEVRRFYYSYREFAMLLREARFVLNLRLNEGDLVVFDNRRVLHGRTEFSPQGKPRWLQGCYLSRDSVLSSWRVAKRGEIE